MNDAQRAGWAFFYAQTAGDTFERVILFIVVVHVVFETFGHADEAAHTLFLVDAVDSVLVRHDGHGSAQLGAVTALIADIDTDITAGLLAYADVAQHAVLFFEPRLGAYFLTMTAADTFLHVNHYLFHIPYLLFYY